MTDRKDGDEMTEVTGLLGGRIGSPVSGHGSRENSSRYDGALERMTAGR
ncbi:MAG: hypothetical protein WAK13_01660 [Terriglobales bacterium]